MGVGVGIGVGGGVGGKYNSSVVGGGFIVVFGFVVLVLVVARGK